MKKQELMIHEWRDDYLKIKLDDYILSFDDGLHSQIEGIRKIINIYPNIDIRCYISTDIMNVERVPSTFNDCRHAHNNYFTNNIKSDYFTYDDIIFLKNCRNVTVGLHGHKHLNLRYLKKNLSLKDYFVTIQDDIREMVFTAINFYEKRIIDKNIHFCYPYNQDCDLYLGSMRKQFAMYIPDATFDITGPGRLDVDRILKLA